MAFPWYCGYCSKWQPASFSLCPTCGRSSSGRRCRKCKQKVPGHAIHCPHCGGDHFIQPASKQIELARWQKVSLGLVSLTTGTWLALNLPWILRWLFHQLFCILIYTGIHLALFLLFTSFLPEGLRKRIRAGAWWLVKLIWRGVSNLFA